MLNTTMGNETIENNLLSERLSAALDAGKIRYCHWKSNEHLKAGLLGKTDLDILVDRKDSVPFIAVITRLGYRKVISSPETTYDDVENWIGFCGRTGILIHLHVHFELVTGMEFVKEYAFPWSGHVLDTAVREPESGFLITSPDVEIILLLLRLGVKAKYRTLLASRLTGRSPYGEAMQRELDYLHERLTCDGLEDALDRMFAEDSALKGILGRLAFRRIPDAESLARVKREVDREFGRCRRYGRMETAWKSMRGNLRLKRNLVMERLGYDVIRRKRFEDGGIVIAVIGKDEKVRADLVRNTEKWLRWKMDVHSYPIPKGDMDRNIGKADSLRQKGSIVLLEGGPDRIADTAARASGMERFPSPLKAGYSLHVVPDERDREEELGRKIEAFTPDLVIRLDHAGTHSETSKRSSPPQEKGLHTVTGHRQDGKLEAAMVYEVDATRPMEAVILEVRRIIWNHL
jgi:hypothetical protein